MRTCLKCGNALKATESLLCLECDPSIQDGCTVQEEWGRKEGKAFIRNSQNQWLVFFNDGSTDIVHQTNLKRIL